MPAPAEVALVKPGPTVASATSSSRGFWRGIALGLLLATLITAGLYESGLVTGANHDTTVKLQAEWNQLERQMRNDLQQTQRERDLARTRGVLAEQTLRQERGLYQELTRTHAESLEILRATQAERDELHARLAEAEAEVSAALASGGSSFIRRWQVLGPLKNPDSRTRSDIEREPFSPQLRVAGARGEVRWKLLESESDRISLDRACNYREPGEGYLICWVYSPMPQGVRLSIGSDDGCCVWVNRDRVMERRESRAASPGQDRARADLRAGWNEILAHVDNSGGNEWAFYLELQTPDGGKPLFLSHSPTPPRPRFGRGDRS